MVPMDSKSQPLRPGILYGIDTRAVCEIEEIEDTLGPDELLGWSRMELSSQAIGPKIAWYRRNEPDLFGLTLRIGTATSYLVFRLTGEFAIDHHQAAHFIPLYDPANQCWSERYSAGICDIKLLPKLGWPTDIAGAVLEEAAIQTGIPRGTPVTIGTVDALSEAVSVGAIDSGDLMIMYGSTGFFILTTNEPVVRTPLWSLPGAFPKSNVLAAGMATTGALTRWLAEFSFDDGVEGKDEIASRYETLFNEAEQVAPGSDGLLMLPYFSGERTPINDPLARGVIAGLSLAHTRGHVFRAALEGIAFGIRHNLEYLAEEAPVVRCVAVGGGTQSQSWLQLVTDVTGRAQLLPDQTVGASYGDAFLAAIGTGVRKIRDLPDWVRHRDEIRPDVDQKPFYDVRFREYLDLYNATRPVVHDLANDTAGKGGS
jgi:xylulokinase